MKRRHIFCRDRAASAHPTGAEVRTLNKEAGCIVIIGGGIMGWILAVELTKRGILCKIIDIDPPGGYASTGNQSWMQSGALYLAKPVPDEVTAEACRKGYHSRSEEHTSELQSRSDLVCRLLLEKKKKKKHPTTLRTNPPLRPDISKLDCD